MLIGSYKGCPAGYTPCELIPEKSFLNKITNRCIQPASNESCLIKYFKIFIFFIFIFFIFIFFDFFKPVKKSELVTKQFIKNNHDAKITKIIKKDSITKSLSHNNYNINFWVYINNINFEDSNDKCILYMGSPPKLLNDSSLNFTHRTNLSIWLLKNTNKMRVIVGSDQDDKSAATICDIDNLPSQKWCSVNIAMKSNIVEIFINGNLRNRCTLNVFAPIITPGNMVVSPSGGFNGYISNMKYSNKALSPEEINKIYKLGPSLKSNIFYNRISYLLFFIFIFFSFFKLVKKK